MVDKPAGEGTPHRLHPLEGRYGVLLPDAVMALVPFIFTTTAYVLFSKDVGKDLGGNPTALEIISGCSVAAYAYGALMGADVISRFPQRRLFLILESIFVAAAVLTAVAPGIVAFGAGNALQGLTTGLMLVVALPPVIQRFPAEKMPLTAAAINMGFFGAITAGPLIGGAVALAHAWRWYYAGLAGIGALVWIFAFLSLPHQKPKDPEMPFDWHAALLGIGATFLPFYGSSTLSGNGFASYRFTITVGLGIICFVALILSQYLKKDPLSPVKPMWHTLPVIGTLIAMAGGGVYVTLVELGLRYLSGVRHAGPLASGLAFWPMLPGVIISAVLLGALIKSRYLPVFMFSGMLCLIAAGLLLSKLAHPPAYLAIAAALLGLGAGATVSPALWVAGFALPSKMVGRVFALVELVRSVADFLLAPVMMQVAIVASGMQKLNSGGIAEAAWITTLVASGVTGICIILYAAAKSRLAKPDLEGWLKQSQPAFPSPPLVAAMRGDGSTRRAA